MSVNLYHLWHCSVYLASPSAAQSQYVTGRCEESSGITYILGESVTVATSHRLKMVPSRVVKVHASPAMVGIDLSWQAHLWVCPVNDATLLDALENAIKNVIIDQKGVVLTGEGYAWLGKTVRRHPRDGQ